MINLEWYRSFVAIYRIGTVSGAAQTCFLTQPAVSQHLAALEKIVGTPLFLRTPRRMVPTDRGKELYSHIADSFDRLDQTTQLFDGSTSAEKARLRIGTPLEYFYEIVIEKLQAVPFRLSFKFDIASNLAQRLSENKLDIIITSQRTPISGIEYLPFTEERFCLVGSSGINLPDNEFTSYNLSELKNWLTGQKWISYSVELPIIRRFWQMVFHHRPEFQPYLVIPNLHAIVKAVELDYGISIVPEYLCGNSFRTKRLKLLWSPDFPIRSELYVGLKTSDRNNLLIKRFRDIVTDWNSEKGFE